MKKTLLSVLFCAAAIVTNAATINYTADNSIFPNPERGFYLHTEKHVSKSSATCLSSSSLEAHKTGDCGTLVLIVYYLDNFVKTATLPEEILTGFDQDMQKLRDKGMKCVLRFAYAQGTYGSGSSESAKDATLAIALGHLSQYKQHLQDNADVIYVVQAGIVGAWGEWYYSDNFGNQTSHLTANRRTLIDSLLKIVPADRCIQLRTPLFKTEYIGDTKPLTKADAYKDIPRARIGHHNDAFLYDYDNMGTYNDTAKQKPYLAQETLYVPMGGECDVDSTELAQIFCSREKTVADMSRLHWTYINKGYALKTTNMWRNNGTFDELNRYMGYRFQLVNATLPEQANAGAKANINIKIKNVGYAPLYNERPAYLVLKSSSKTYSIKLESDPRTWLPNGVETVINEQVKIPSTVPSGTYQMYLNLPDAYASLASKPAFSVRFANTNVWESSTGMNKLNASIQITNDGSIPVDPDDAITLPATLDINNVNAVSEDMTYYNTSYFDFGPDDAANLDRWAEWQVNLKYPGEYIVSAIGAYPNGHQWKLELLNSGADTLGLPESWATGEEVVDNAERHWVLTNVPAGVYMLRVTNIMPYGQPKLKSLTLEYDGVIPIDPQAIEEISVPLDINAPMYDITGRRVNASYRGVILQNGHKYIIW